MNDGYVPDRDRVMQESLKHGEQEFREQRLLNLSAVLRLATSRRHRDTNRRSRTGCAAEFDNPLKVAARRHMVENEIRVR
jgi:hypothetical protein